LGYEKFGSAFSAEYYNKNSTLHGILGDATWQLTRKVWLRSASVDHCVLSALCRRENGVYNGTDIEWVFLCQLQKSPSGTLKLFMVNLQTKEAMNVKVQDQNNIHLFARHQGYIHFDFVSIGATVKQTFYVEVLKMLIDTVRRSKRGELWRHCPLILHQNALTYSSIRVLQFTGEVSCHGSLAVLSGLGPN
jgi:hypothetical protein